MQNVPVDSAFQTSFPPGARPQGGNYSQQNTGTFHPWLPVLVLPWLCGVAVMTLRLFSGWLWVQRMKSQGATPAPEVVREMAGRLARRLHVGRVVTLLESRPSKCLP